MKKKSKKLKTQLRVTEEYEEGQNLRHLAVAVITQALQDLVQKFPKDPPKTGHQRNAVRNIWINKQSAQYFLTQVLPDPNCLWTVLAGDVLNIPRVVKLARDYKIKLPGWWADVASSFRSCKGSGSPARNETQCPSDTAYC